MCHAMVGAIPTFGGGQVQAQCRARGASAPHPRTRSEVRGPADPRNAEADEEAAEKANDAIRSLEIAEAASGDVTLAEARRLVDAIGAQSAAAALTTIAAAAKSCDAGALPAVRAVERAVRPFPGPTGEPQRILGSRGGGFRGAP